MKKNGFTFYDILIIIALLGVTALIFIPKISNALEVNDNKDEVYNEILKNRCLKEIPKQVVEFYKINKTSPDNIRENKLENIHKSFKKSLNIINIQNNNKVEVIGDYNKDNIDPKVSKVLKLNENKEHNDNKEIKDYQGSDSNFNLFKHSDKDLNNKIVINNSNNKDIVNDNLNKNNITQQIKHENKKKERINEINSDNGKFINDFNIISFQNPEPSNDNFIKESNFLNNTPENMAVAKDNQITIMENPFSQENKKYIETPDKFPKKETKNMQNPYRKSNNIKKEEDSKGKVNEIKETDILNKFPKQQDERKMQNETPVIKEREELEKKYVNPYSQRNKREENSNKNHHQINDNENKRNEINNNKYLEKETHRGSKPQNMMNPYKKQQQYSACNTDQNINDINDLNDKIYYNKTPNPNPNPNNDQKVINIVNPYGKPKKADDKKFCNITPGNELGNQIKNYNAMENPFRKKGNLNKYQRNPFRKDKESNQIEINEQQNRIMTEKAEKQNNKNRIGNQFLQSLEMIKKNSFKGAKKINSNDINEKNIKEKPAIDTYYKEYISLVNNNLDSWSVYWGIPAVKKKSRNKGLLSFVR